jgi:hypothetical protein
VRPFAFRHALIFVRALLEGGAGVAAVAVATPTQPTAASTATIGRKRRMRRDDELLSILERLLRGVNRRFMVVAICWVGVTAA